MIPTKIIITGDRDIGLNFVNYAKGQLGILQHQMSITLPNPLPEGYRTVHPYPGVVVECWASYDISEVRIHISKEYSKAVHDKLKEKRRQCVLFSCYTVGFIIGPTEGVDMLSVDRRYDVEVCRLKTYYLRINACNTSDFAVYDVGEQVLVSTKWNTLDCCSNPPVDGFKGYVITPLKSNFPRWRDAL